MAAADDDHAAAGDAAPMLAEPQADSGAGYGLGTIVAVLSAVLFAVGAVLQHEAAESSTTDRGLSWRQLLRRPKWFAGQLATVCGTGLQVVALALAPVAVVQPVLAVALVVALAIRAVRNRQVPLRLELVGAGLTTGGLAVFLLAAKPATGEQTHEPSAIAVLAAVAVSIVLVAVATLLKRGAHGALACGCAAGVAAGIAAVLISVGLHALREGGWVHALAGIAIWGALVTAVVAQLGGQQAYARGSLAWSLPALILLDPVSAIPAARLLLGERLEPGHAVVWLPAAVVAAVGVVMLARTGERAAPDAPPDRPAGQPHTPRPA
jgi:drug/metabolite transporter (DMT)-like permease